VFIDPIDRLYFGGETLVNIFVPVTLPGTSVKSACASQSRNHTSMAEGLLRDIVANVHAVSHGTCFLFQKNPVQ
jgi:hypothetical protein